GPGHAARELVIVLELWAQAVAAAAPEPASRHHDRPTLARAGSASPTPKMHSHNLRLPLVLAFVAAICWTGPLSAQQFIRNTTSIPASGGHTENVDFGDVDGDGDWDAIFANGGDAGNEQNVIWINQGGLQGGTVGVFTNETAARFPALLDDSRD